MAACGVRSDEVKETDDEEMKYILVTGANKGIGFALCKAILKDHKDAYVFVGARNVDRGNEAVKKIKMVQDYRERVELLELDVTSDRSVKQACIALKKRLGKDRLYALVNNAAIRQGTLQEMFNVNVNGIRRVTNMLFHQDFNLFMKGARVVNLSSDKAPEYVWAQQIGRQRQFATPYAWQDIDRMMKADLKAEKAVKKPELDKMEEYYGQSKAYVNLLTMALAQALKKANIKINSCEAGLVATDMTKHIAVNAGKRQKDMGMVLPEFATNAQMFCLFGELKAYGPQRFPGTGCFYSKELKVLAFDEPRDPNKAATPKKKEVFLSGWHLNTLPYVPASARQHKEGPPTSPK